MVHLYVYENTNSALMEHTCQISDEMLASYLSGAASDEEASMVESWVAASDDHLKEICDMAESIVEHRRTLRGRGIDEDKKLEGIRAEGEKTPISDGRYWRRRVYYSVAAAILLFVGIAAYFSYRNHTTTHLDPSHSTAAIDSTETTNVITDTLLSFDE